MELDRRTLALLAMGWLEISLDEYENYFNVRKAVQKIIYLQQARDFGLNYDYNLYIKGPYSRELTHDLYRAKEEGVNSLNLVNGYNSTPSYDAFLDFIRHNFPSDSEPYDSRKLELWGTFAFLWKESSLRIYDETERLDKIIEWFSLNKPQQQYEESEINEAYNQLRPEYLD